MSLRSCQRPQQSSHGIAEPCATGQESQDSEDEEIAATFAQADVLALQELHGTRGKIEGSLFEQVSHSEVFVCHGVDRNFGGTALLIKK